MQSTDTPQLTTDAPQVTVLDTLRSVALPPRPEPPERPLTARRLSRDLDPYVITETPKVTAAPAPYTPEPRPGALLARDLYDSHHADLAFGGAA
jgi:hypothetical protein